jgi:hypothetical protein
MIKFAALQKRVLVLLAAALLVAFQLSGLYQSSQVSAAQLSQRSIRMTSSELGQTSVTYNVSFIPSVATAIEGIVIDICQNSPLIGQSCTKGAGNNGIDATPDSPTTIVVSQTGATPASETFDVHANSDTDGLIILTHATGITTASTVNPITFSFTATNPTGTATTNGVPGTFYARLLTYTDESVASAYTSTAVGTHIDDGGVALSTARQLSVTARVQERLEFCVAAIPGTVDTDAEAYANCAAMPTTTSIDLGIVESANPSISGDQTTAPQGNDTNGGILIRTNAVGGATISYFAEQDTSSGQLKVPGSTCTAASVTDQCFNSADSNGAGAGAPPVDISATSGENFGFQVRYLIYPTGSTTTNLLVNSDYNSVTGHQTPNNATSFAWVDTQPAANTPASSLASSTTNTVKVLDYEMLVLRFGARTAATTPTGTYTVTSTYIATSIF